jgi:hypothetical protein
MQAFKIVQLLQRRRLVLPRTLVVSMVALADHPEDDFRRVCLEAIRRLALVHPRTVAECGGIKLMVNSILDPDLTDISQILTFTLLALLDQPATRSFFRPSLVRLLLNTHTPAPMLRFSISFHAVFRQFNAMNMHAQMYPAQELHRLFAVFTDTEAQLEAAASDAGDLVRFIPPQP